MIHIHTKLPQFLISGFSVLLMTIS